MEQDEYLKVVSERLHLRQDLLRKRLSALRRQGSSARSNQTTETPVPKLSIPPGKPEERDLIVLLLQGRLAPEQIEQLDEEAFTIPLYRHILAQALQHRNPEGQVSLEHLHGELQEDPAYESLISQLSVWDLYIEDIPAHVSGCFRVLGNKLIQRRMDNLISQLKIAERDGCQEIVDALVVEINTLRGKKAMLSVSSSVAR